MRNIQDDGMEVGLDELFINGAIKRRIQEGTA